MSKLVFFQCCGCKNIVDGVKYMHIDHELENTLIVLTLYLNIPVYANAMELFTHYENLHNLYVLYGFVDRRDDGTVNAACIGWRHWVFLKVFWKTIVMVITPFICALVFLFLGTDKKFRCMYVILVMAVYWMTQPIPLAVTSLIPIVAFPVLGILSTGETTVAYFTHTVVLCIGGVMFAVAMESSNLHNRIAIKTLLIAGASHRKLLLGLTIVTALISMWVPNAAATTMVCPIVAAILFELETSAGQKAYTNKTMTEVMNMTPDDIDIPEPTDTTVCYYLIIAYAATLGGNGTLVGTGTNLALKGIYEKFPEADLSFPSFMAFGVPLMLLSVPLVYIWMQIWFMGMFRPYGERAKEVQIEEAAQNTLTASLKAKYEELGTMSFQEAVVIVLFILMLLLLVFRNPSFIDGYVIFFNTDLPNYQEQNLALKDASPIILIIIMLFIIPKSMECFTYCKNVPLSELPMTTTAIVTWPYMQAKTSWGLLFLIGSGFALAKGGEESGMSEYLGIQLRGLESLSPLGIMTVMIVFSNMITEFGSNVAIANIVLPILSSLAQQLKIHPLYLLLPAGVSCSMSFMLPVGTPPNAIVQELGKIPTGKMMAAGLVPSILTMLTVLLVSVFLTPLIWPETTGFPSWAALDTAAAATGNATA